MIREKLTINFTINPFKVEENDQLPQKICNSCLKNVLAACDIKQKCIETDLILRQQFKNETEPCVTMELELKLKVEDNETRFVPDGDIFEMVSRQSFTDRKHRRKRKSSGTTAMDKLPRETKISHPRNKPKTQDFKCFLCGQVFAKVGTKIEHIKKDHASELICRICKSRKPSSISTEKCLKDHEVGFDYLCQVRKRSLD